MTNELKFTLTFHGPFAVTTGAASGGIDRRVDPDNPVPASSLKGLMRHEALNGLGIAGWHIDRIFGDQRHHPATWRWTDAAFTAAPKPSLWARVALDDDGRAEERLLMIGEQLWATTAVFSVVPTVTASAHDAEDRLVLRAAARHMTSIGQQRRRGLGWVSVQDSGHWTAQDSTQLIDIIKRA